MNDQELRDVIRGTTERQRRDVETLCAALVLLDSIGAYDRAGKTRSGGKQITSARRAAADVRALLANRYGKVV